MRRSILVALLSGVMVVLAAGPAFAAACTNQSKPAGAGNHTNVVIDAFTEEVTIDGFNGGWADVWLDLNGDGVGDVLLEADVQIGQNHSGQFDDSEGPWINPGSIKKALSEHATDEHGMIIHLEP